MVEKSQPLYRGILREVRSGDLVIVHRTMKDGSIQEKQLHLANLSAPKLGNANRNEEPFAFDAREFIRLKCIGQKVEFKVEYSANEREYGVLTCKEENINEGLLQNGLVKLFEKHGKAAEQEDYQLLKQVEEEAKAKQKGIHNSDPQFVRKHTRDCIFNSQQSFQNQEVLKKGVLEQKPMPAIIEYVFSPTLVSVYVKQLNVVMRLQMVHCFLPKENQNVAEAGKKLVNKLLLQKDVAVQLFSAVENSDILIGRIHFHAGDIASEVVKAGYAKVQIPKNKDGIDAEYLKQLKVAQTVSQSKQAGIWKGYVAPESQDKSTQLKKFDGRVVEIHSGDSLTIEDSKSKQQFRVYLSCCKAPAIRRDKMEPWAFESKEALRKTTIGKEVRVEPEYKVTIPGKDGKEDMLMDFASVIVLKNNKNACLEPLEKGLLKINLGRDDENAGPYVEDLLAAEQKAIKAKKGIHSKKDQPAPQFTDYIQNLQRAKAFEQMMMKKPNKELRGVIDYCFSGMKFKVRIDGEGCYIAFGLNGVRTLNNDKNQPIQFEFHNKALNFAKEKLLQRDVTLDLEFADKRGGWFGTLIVGQKDFASELLSRGLAQVSVVGNKGVNNLETYEDLEYEAKENKVGIWAEGLTLMTDAGRRPDEIETEEGERIKIEMTDIVDATKFHVRILNNSSIEEIDNKMAEFDYENAGDLEQPIKKGTLCAAKFEADNGWYRAKVLQPHKDGVVEVQFMDYGNVEQVHQRDLKVLPQNLLGFPPQVSECTLAYVKAPRIDRPYGKDAAQVLQEMALDRVTEAIVVGKRGVRTELLIFEEGKNDWNKSINATLVDKALACIVIDRKQAPETISEWFEWQQEAKDEQINIWQYGDESD